VRAQFGSDLVLAVGRLVPYKGFRYLIAAMKSVAGNLVIIGKGPLEEDLRQYARELGVADKVHFLGLVPSVRPYYRAASVLVLPSISRAEAFGLVQLEAMAAGLPVINTQIDSGVPEVCPNGITGITVPPCDSTALANSLHLLMENEELRSRLGSAARVRVREEYRLDLMVDRTVGLYDEVLEGC
jgi:rhamnosyl/mannosyltransferase